MTNTIEAIDIDNEPSIRRIIARLWNGDNPLWLRENGENVALIAGVVDFSGLREAFDNMDEDDEAPRHATDNAEG